MRINRSLLPWLLVMSTLLIMITMVSKPARSSPTLIASECSFPGNFDPNSKFQDNLNNLLSHLTSNAATNNPTGFYNSSVGSNTKNAVYGFFLCRGDQTTQGCSECVHTAVNNLTMSVDCVGDNESIIWYDECMVRYSQQPIFGRLETTPSVFMWNSQNNSALQKWYSKNLGSLLQSLAGIAITTTSDDANRKKFYYTVARTLSGSEPFYALVQCTPDLTENDCKQCLTTAISRLSTRQGGRVFMPSCHVRYDDYNFFTQALSPPPASRKKKVLAYVAIAISATIFVIIIMVLLFAKRYGARRRGASKTMGRTSCASKTFAMVDDDDDYPIESLQFSLGVLQTATNNFCDDNKIGEGGFGRVYKGILPNRKHIAIKKLIRNSDKGEEEFKNEMKVVAKLQHKNLVRLMGFCLAGDERLLVFEFVPNKSLDHFIFDAEKRRQLSWSSRFRIITDVARALLYLHEYSRVKIIHRDLKPANILLDEEMNPKIADFGMARIFGMNQNPNSFDQDASNIQQILGADQSHQITKQAGGTLGYMAPEYVQTLHFSAKTDVYSFGVIVLEIISGKKNSSFYQLGLAQDLLTYAWTLWRANTPLEMVDTTLEESYSKDEVIRCIHIGLLCVQKDPNVRPTMANILHILNISSTTTNVVSHVLQPPAVFANSRSDGEAYSSGSNKLNKPLILVNKVSIDEDPITQLYPR